MGGLLISNRTNDHLEFFEETKEAIFYDTIEELNDKLKFINHNKNQVQSIKNNAYDRCKRSNYSYHYRVSEIIKIIYSHLNQ
jgi:spore maturation protein CgeB